MIKSALAGLGLFIVGCGGGNATPVPMPARSFEIDATLSWTGEDFGMPAQFFPGHHRFTVTLDVAKTGQEKLIVGGNGQIASVPVAASAGGRFSYKNGDHDLLDQRRMMLMIDLPSVDAASCSFLSGVSFQTLDLQVTGDSATGQGSGIASFQEGDSLGVRSFTATLSGSADRTGPALGQPAAEEVTIHPFDGLIIEFPEALPMATGVRLTDGATAYTLLPLPHDYPSQFITGTRLLPFGQRLRFESDTLRDLAGNPEAPPALTVVTPALPGPFVGFTDAVAAQLTGQARIVDETVIPILAGKRALLLDGGDPSANLFPGGRFTARLAVPDGATTLVISARALVAANGGGPWLRTRFGVMGGTINEFQTEIPWGIGAPTPSGLAAFPQMFPPTQFRQALPAGAHEVVVDLSSEELACGAILPPGASLIDSLTVE